MKKRLWTSFFALSRFAVLTLVALSMAASFAFPSVTVRVPTKSHVEPTAVSGQNQLLSGTAESEESTGKMGTGRKQQAAPIIVAVLSSSHKSDDGLQRRTINASDQAIHVLPFSDNHEIKLTTSVSQVSAEVARQFTLVGAKPSGTM